MRNMDATPDALLVTIDYKAAHDLVILVNSIEELFEINGLMMFSRKEVSSELCV